ncbi:MAG TPA: PH domain-containing protein [Acidimicrobiales bacterium]|nr:PH domain-containing protein [Acidimicrobiales bacterium]
MTNTASPGWTPLSPTLMKMRVTEIAVITAVLAATTGSVAWAEGSAPVALITIVAVALCGAGAWWFVHNRFRAWGYLERAEDLEVRRGVMVQRLSVVPYGRMQFVEITTGPVERLFGLATVKLHTAAAASDARIPGLEPVEAARLRDRLAALGEAKAAGL